MTSKAGNVQTKRDSTKSEPSYRISPSTNTWNKLHITMIEDLVRLPSERQFTSYSHDFPRFRHIPSNSRNLIKPKLLTKNDWNLIALDISDPGASAKDETLSGVKYTKSGWLTKLRKGRVKNM